jgi:hypothetical protein
MIFGIITLLIIIILLFIANMYVNNENLRSLVGTLLIVFSSLLGTSISEYLTIPPIEVYRGNTELEITYKNNIPIDTVVVRKTNN